MNTQIAYCGVNCFACSDYINKICPSCKHTQWTEEDICMPVKCCKEKGIDFCAFCNNFPCDDMADFFAITFRVMIWQIFMRSQKVTKKHITEWYR